MVLESSRTVWGCCREDLAGPGGAHVDPWGLWIHPEGSGDVPEGSCGVQEVPGVSRTSSEGFRRV